MRKRNGEGKILKISKEHRFFLIGQYLLLVEARYSLAVLWAVVILLEDRRTSGHFCLGIAELINSNKYYSATGHVNILHGVGVTEAKLYIQ